VLLKEMQSLALDVNVKSEEGAGVEIRDEDDDLLRAAEGSASTCRECGHRSRRERRARGHGRVEGEGGQTDETAAEQLEEYVEKRKRADSSQLTADS